MISANLKTRKPAIIEDTFVKYGSFCRKDDEVFLPNNFCNVV